MACLSTILLASRNRFSSEETYILKSEQNIAHVLNYPNSFRLSLILFHKSR